MVAIGVRMNVMSIFSGNWHSGVSGGGEQVYTTARTVPATVRSKAKSLTPMLLCLHLIAWRTPYGEQSGAG